jgi:hypothetical protein
MLASVLITSCEQLRIDITSPVDGDAVAGGHLMVRYEIRGATGEVKYACALDSEAEQPCLFMAPPEDPLGPASVIGLMEPLAAGPHTFRVTVRDDSGRSARDAVSFTATEAMRVTVSSPLPMQWVTGTSVTATFTVSTSSVDESFCAIDSGMPVPCTSPHVFSGLSQGMHNIRIGARSGLDEANESVLFFVYNGPLAQVRQIAAGAGHSCARFDNIARCWGDGSSGKLGDGDTKIIGDDEHPGLSGQAHVGGAVAEIAPGGQHTCALLTSGAVRCWGRGGAALGYGNTETIGDDELPEAAGDVELGGTVTELAAGETHTCALLPTGNVRCWGLGELGRLGHGNTTTIGDDEVPASAGDVNVGQRVIQISAGRRHTCALTASGRVRCWGAGESGVLGYANTRNIHPQARVTWTWVPR